MVHRGKIIVYCLLMAESEGKIPTERSRVRRDDDNNMEMKAIKLDRVEWIHLARYRNK
jgi:hypothetical protein